MPATITYPGVYVEELPSGVRTITGVSTSITAFIGRALRGPVNSAVIIHSFADFERNFGGLWRKSNMSYAVYQYFLNGGKDAVIVRVVYGRKNDTEEEKKREAKVSTHEMVISFIWDIVDTDDDEGNKLKEFLKKHFSQDWITTALKVTKEAATNKITIASTDGANSLVIQLDQPPAAATSAKVTINGTDQTDAFATQKVDEKLYLYMTATQEFSFIWDIVDTDDDEGNKLKEFLKKHFSQDWITTALKVTKEAATNKITIASTDGANSLVIQLDQPPAAATSAKVTINGTDQTDAFSAERRNETLYLSMKNIPFRLEFRSISPGLWGKDLSVEIDHDVDADKLKKEDGTLFKLVVTDTKIGTVESFPNLSADRGSTRFITRILEEESNLLRVDGDIIYGRPPETLSMVREPGNDGAAPDDSDIAGSASSKTGIYALDNTDLFNMLCIPPYTSDESTDGGVYTEALGYCKRKRAMLLVDPPKEWKTKEKARTAIDDGDLGLHRDENAAIFFPRILAFDPLEQNRLREFVPCGAVAVVIARTDSQRGIWKSAAGIEATLMGVPNLTINLTDQDNGDLNPLGINCLRILPVAGRVVWGARTMRGADRLADQWKYLAVRRMALYIEESLYRGTQWVVFEPNDEPLWSQIRLNIGAFMHNLFTQGAFQGSNPKEAYLVKCDKETTTQYDIDRGIVNIIVGFAPLKPAEFVILKIQQLAGREAK